MLKLHFPIALMNLLLLFCTTEAHASHEKKVAVTYRSKGRLGNQLIAYLHGKWISYKYDIPLLYKPFEYSNQFKFHELEPYLLKEQAHLYRNHILLQKFTIIPKLHSTLVTVPYFRDDKEGKDNKKRKFQTDWQDPAFREIIKTHLQPRFPVNTVTLPEDKLTVLVHVRRGGHFDSLETRLKYPLKFPPDSFFISAIETMSELFENQPMYVYLMTDDPDPKEMIQNYQNALPHLTNLTFDCSSNESEETFGVIEDFFSISKFDCFIRGDSTFAIVASLLGEYQAIITPKRAHVENKQSIVDEINIQTPTN